VPFDSIAASYDATFGVSPAGRLFRFRLAERVVSKAPFRARILDLGCGTGEDALWLASQGFSIHGVDQSQGMIHAAQLKAARFHSAATFECRGIETLKPSDSGYDVVISNFGALNCLPLSTWSAVVPQLLKPSGCALVVLMGRQPLPEGMRRGFGETDRGTVADVPLGDSRMKVHYARPAEVCEALEKTSVVEAIEPLGFLVPGPGYAGFPRRYPMTFAALAMAESALRAVPLFRGRGDHTLYEFRLR
jgi:SAM-dependent methyltransferase